MKTSIRTYCLGVVTSAVIGFATAFVWHLVLFQKLYENLGVIGRIEPNIPLGFIATLALSFVLAYLYLKIISPGDSPVRGGIRFGITVGVLNIIFWVLKFAATQPLTSIPIFMVVECAFELIQLTLVGIALGFIYRRKQISRAVSNK